MDGHCVGLPGAFNGLVGRAVRDAGFEGAYVSGAAVSAAFGVPDVGLVTLTEFRAVIEQVVRGTGGMPVIADADTGFGEGEMVRRAVHEYHRAGAAGFHIEDQVFPKRCGHLDGKQLVPVDHFQEKVAAAASASAALAVEEGSPDDTGEVASFWAPAPERAVARGPFIVCARTDAVGVEGFDAAVARAKAYTDAGAEMIFPEGLGSEAEFGRFAQAVREHAPGVYLLANMTEFGKTPIIPLKRFGELGYSCVIWPVSTLRSAMGEVVRLLGALQREGTVASRQGEMLDRKGLYSLLGYTPGVEWEWPGRAERT